MDNFNFDEDIIEEEGVRQYCDQCQRPIRTCWCQYLPKPKIKLSKTKVIIIQHPNETKRAIRTAKMLEHGLEDCLIFVRRKVMTLEIKDNLSSEEKTLRSWLSHPGAHLLFPRKNAKTPEQLHNSNLEEMVLIVLDGTWDEAKKMYSWSPALQALPKIILDLSKSQVQSQFVIKTQPNNKCLSTVECVAHTLAVFENRSEIVENLTKPLLAMCSIQISHGAVKHESKEFKKDVASFTKENCRKNKSKVTTITSTVEQNN